MIFNFKQSNRACVDCRVENIAKITILCFLKTFASYLACSIITSKLPLYFGVPRKFNFYIKFIVCVTMTMNK